MSAFERQEGGLHYNEMMIQPATYILVNGIGWAEGCAIAYISRWRKKGGISDLRKAIHTLELLIENEVLAQKGSGLPPMQEQRR